MNNCWCAPFNIFKYCLSLVMHTEGPYSLGQPEHFLLIKIECSTMAATRITPARLAKLNVHTVCILHEKQCHGSIVKTHIICHNMIVNSTCSLLRNSAQRCGNTAAWPSAKIRIQSVLRPLLERVKVNAQRSKALPRSISPNSSTSRLGDMLRLLNRIPGPHTKVTRRFSWCRILQVLDRSPGPHT